MKVTFYTTQKNSPATVFYLAGLKAFPNLELFSTDWKKFDIALIMGFREDFSFVREAKKQNPKLKIGVIDPRGRYIAEIMPLVDFFIVDSLEMIDFFAQYTKPIFQYYEYYPVAAKLKEHSSKDKIVIGYHGNKVHLMSLWPGVAKALTAIAKERKIIFKAIYNVEKLGKWEIGCPPDVEMQHVQLKDETYQEEIHSCDIGIVPAFSPVPKSIYSPSIVDRKIYLLDEDDYVLRFKVPSNAGRIIVFALLGVPVVADMLPSSCQFIQHGENGYLAYSAGGWYQALMKLIDSPELRNKFSKNLQQHTLKTVDYPQQNIELEKFLKEEIMSGNLIGNPEIAGLKFTREVYPNLNFTYVKTKLLKGRGALI